MAMVLRNRKRSRDLPSEKGPPVVAKQSPSTTMIESPFTDKDHFLRSCLKLQTEVMMPLDYWDSGVARMVYGPYERIYNVSVRTKDMEKRLRSECTTALDQLETKLWGQMFSMKLETVPGTIDCLGVSVQFMENFAVKIAHLGSFDASPKSSEDEYDSGPDWESFQFDPRYREELQSLLQVAGLYYHQLYSTTLSHDFPYQSDLNRRLDNEPGPFPTFSRPVVDKILRVISQWYDLYRKDLKMYSMNTYNGFGATIKELAELQRKKSNGSTKLTPVQLILVDQLLRDMKPFQEMMENGFKSKQYTCGDLIWDLRCWESELAEHNDEVSTTLLEEIKKQRAKLLENNQFQAAMYLDPRHNNCNNTILTDEQKGKILNYLLKAFNEIVNVERRSAEEYYDECDDDEEPSWDWEDNRNWADEVDKYDADDTDDEDEEEDEDKILRKELKDLLKALKDLDYQPEPSPDFNIAVYWQANTNATLKKLANVVLAHPVSQAPFRGDFYFDPKMLTSNKEKDLKNLMKMHIGYTADM